MTQTTTAKNACDASIWIDNVSGVLTDVSGSSNTINMEFTEQVGTVRNFGTRWQILLTCGLDATFGFTAVYSMTANEAKAILLDWFFNKPGTNKTIKVYLPDKNVGSDVYTAEVKLISMPITVEAGSAEPMVISCQLRPDGPVTWVTNAT